MVDVGAKPESRRFARAEGAVRMSAEAFELIAGARVAKGDVLGVARIAGIQAAKRTAELIPLCHPLAVEQIEVRLEPDPALPGVRVSAGVRITARTGVEMEALTAVAVACLTVYDMVKSADRGMTIEAIRLVEKTGGQRGAYNADSARQGDEHG
jgi:cyclic pyranopterin phosphate synthase